MVDSAPDSATTPSRTHRALRLSLAMVVLPLFAGVAVEVVRSGGLVLPAISLYFYTPAQGLFVGALVAASLALVALAGRDLETVFLDVAAVFAPLIALVPTSITRAQWESITGDMGPCAGDSSCIPTRVMDAVHTGVVTYTIVVICVVMVALWVRRGTFRTMWRTRADAAPGRAWTLWSALTAPAVAVVVAVVLNLAAFVPPLSENFPFPPWLPIGVHFSATILFFAAFSAVPVINVARYLRSPREARAARMTRRYAVIYLFVPVLMALDLVALVVVVSTDRSSPGVLVCEAAALALFAVFWVAQTIQWWREDDPPHLAPRR